MRLLLDANLSPRGVAAPLEASGHDMRALAEEPGLDALDDPAVLALAASEGRILVTRNGRDFAPIFREWAESGRSHAGCILIWTLDHSRFPEIVGRVERLLARRPRQEDWRDVTEAF